MAVSVGGNVCCGIWVLLLVCSAQFATSSKPGCIVVTEENWTDMLQGEWMVKFYAPWCPACKGLEATWNNFAEWSDDLDITVAEVDVTQEPGLSGRFMVTSLPSIYHVINGEFRRYMGPRSKDEFMTFIEDRKYVEIEPVPSWKSPDSIVMSFLGWLFKVSMVVRNIHTSLTEDYNIPVYGSYAIFAIATVVMGLLLGVSLVFITDCICPSRPPKGLQHYKPQMRVPDKKSGKGKEKVNGEEAQNEENEEVIENTEDIDSSISDISLRQRKNKTEERKEQEDGDVQDEVKNDN